jgi:glycosyltransferase involved in cell wall biosynthesis
VTGPGSPAGRMERDPTLLFVSTVPPLIRNFYLPYAAHYRARGWRVLLAARDARHDPTLRAAFDEVVDLPVSRSTLDWRNYTHAFVAIRRLLLAGPDIVHAHSPIAALLVRLAVATVPRGRRPAVVYTVHGFHFHHRGLRVTNAIFRTAERLAGRWTDRLIVMNDEDERSAQSGRFVPEGRLVRMPGVGIDAGYYARSAIPRAPSEAALAIVAAAGRPVFVVVGELHPRKRHEDVVRALAAMRHRDALLVLLGDGDRRPALEALVSRLNVRDRVRFLGFVDDIRPYVALANAVILASLREGLPRAIMEAMALEVPVIVSASRGNVDLVDSTCGFVVPLGSVAGLAGAMDQVVDDPSTATTLGRRGRERIVSGYGLAEVIARHDSLYEELLEERSLPSAILSNQ